ncbi:hypothetical protein HDU93_002208 [Gonapodya sp. JEL0774]|nr:hypothetical protein HDU93_002208 [Gonapodya sp. JEL0774]
MSFDLFSDERLEESDSDDEDLEFAPLESTSIPTAEEPPLVPVSLETETSRAVAPLTAIVTASPPQIRIVNFDKNWIMKHKDGIEKLYPSYELFVEEPDESLTFILAARKRKKSKSSNYVITTTRITSSKSKENVVAKVRSNFLGTEFTIYDNGRNPFGRSERRFGDNDTSRAELAAVLYDHNILGFKGPRKVRVLLNGMSQSGEQTFCRPQNRSETLISRYKYQNDSDILVLHNKSPQWNEETQSYVLNFNGRVQLASVKNFQVVSEHDLDYVLLQFGRVSEDAFTLDFQYPLSCVLALSIALTSFDSKIACE